MRACVSSAVHVSTSGQIHVNQIKCLIPLIVVNSMM